MTATLTPAGSAQVTPEPAAPKLSAGAVLGEDAVPAGPKRSQSRKHRGYLTQRLVAEWLRAHGWPFAESTGAGRQGADITGCVGLAVEVKAVPGDNSGALKQAHGNRGELLPLVVWRPNGYGPERIAEWPVLLRLDDLTTLLRQAGYGTPEAS